MLPSHVQPVIDDLLPIIHALAEGRCAVSIAGSLGRGNFDRLSDIDFRMYCDAVSADHMSTDADLDAAVQRWGEQGITIDGCWIRSIAEVSAELDQWCNGVASPEHRVWTIWGYHLPCDIHNQAIVDDPDGVIAAWKAQ